MLRIIKRFFKSGQIIPISKNHFLNSPYLSSGGCLITSILTPPPTNESESEWKSDQIDLQAALFAKVLFTDILGAKWQIYRSTQTSIAQLKEAGFSEIEVIPDSAHIMPTLIAQKK